MATVKVHAVIKQIVSKEGSPVMKVTIEVPVNEKKSIPLGKVLLEIEEMQEKLI